jgi:hypothetical protein
VVGVGRARWVRTVDRILTFPCAVTDMRPLQVE